MREQLTCERRNGVTMMSACWHGGTGLIQGGKVVGIVSMVASDHFFIALGSTFYTVPINVGRELPHETP